MMKRFMSKVCPRDIVKLQNAVAALEQVVRLHKEISDNGMTASAKSVDKAYLAAEKATDKSEASTRESFIKVNEFRGALEDQGKLMSTRKEFESLREQLAALSLKVENPADMRELQKRFNTDQGESDGRRSGIIESMDFSKWMIMLLIALAGLYVTFNRYAGEESVPQTIYIQADKPSTTKQE